MSRQSPETQASAHKKPQGVVQIKLQNAASSQASISVGSGSTAQLAYAISAGQTVSTVAVTGVRRHADRLQSRRSCRQWSKIQTTKFGQCALVVFCVVLLFPWLDLTSMSSSVWSQGGFAAPIAWISIQLRPVPGEQMVLGRGVLALDPLHQIHHRR